MKAVNFAFKDNEDEYLTNDFNYLRYRELTKSPEYKNLFASLEFFNLFWHTRALIIANKSTPLEIIRYLHALDLSAKQFYYLLGNLLISFNKSFYPEFSSGDIDAQLDICIHFISDECAELGESLYPGTSYENSIFDFAIIQNNLELITNDIDKLNHLFKVKACYRHYVSDHPGFHSSFGERCDIEIQRIKERIELISSPHNGFASHIPDESLSPVKSPEAMRKFITEKFCALDAAKWQYFFFSEQDHLFCIDLLVNFHSRKELNPSFVLILQPTCKTKFCIALNSIYNKFELVPLRKNKKYLALLSKLSIFDDLTPAEICTDVIRTKF